MELTKEELKQILVEDPDNSAALYNLGLAYFLEEDFAQAIGPWETLCSLEPHDWQLRAKLIQCYWAAGKKDEAATAIKQLRTAWATEKYQDLHAQAFFIRDQFTVGDVRVFALEYYMPEGPRPLLWKFMLSRGEDTLSPYLSVGCYEATTEIMRAKGAIGPDDRVFHLDEYREDGSHACYVFYRNKPTYESVRSEVEQILGGKKQPISSTTVSEDGQKVSKVGDDADLDV